MTRSRPMMLLLIALIIPIGLAARHARSAWPGVTTAYVGDTLWPMLFFLLFALARPRASTWALAAAVLAVTAGIELSQLYHAPWIDTIRSTRIGGLLLGHTFLVSDLVCIIVGTALAAVLDWIARHGAALK